MIERILLIVAFVWLLVITFGMNYHQDRINGAERWQQSKCS